jgi:hypothetical protein
MKLEDSWFVGNDQASSCGFLDQYLMLCNHQMLREQGMRGNNLSTHGQL